MNLILPILFSLLLLGCKPSSSSSPASQGGTSPYDLSQNLPIRWADNKLPLTINISADFTFNPGDLDGAGRNPIEQMEKAWDDAVTSKVFFNFPAPATASLGAADLSSYNDAIIGVYKADDWFTNVSSSALAITQFFAIKKTSASGEYYEMTHADIIVNERDFDFSYNAASNTDYDMSSVILHELGHLLGLGHQFDFSVPAVMQPYMSIWESHRTLFANDSLRIKQNYGVAALSASPFILAASTKKSSIPDGTEYHGVVELHASGECRHFMNGKLIFGHF